MTKREIIQLSCGILLAVLVIGALFKVAHRADTTGKGVQWKKKIDIEKDFPSEAKAVLFAIRTATADLEKSKEELQIMINDAKASLLAENLNQNVNITWADHMLKNEWVYRSDNTSIHGLLGFRSDGVIVWKMSDQP